MPTFEFFLSERRIIHDFITDPGYANFTPGPGETKGFIITITFGAGTPAQATAREAYGHRDATTGVPTQSAARDLCPHPPGCSFTLTGDITTDQKENLIDDDCFL